MCYKQKQDIGHVCIYKETWRRYHELFIIYYTNKKKSEEVQRRVFEKKETSYKFTPLPIQYLHLAVSGSKYKSDRLPRPFFISK